MGLGAMASPAAAPFAYVANAGDNTVSVIDTATNAVVGTPIPVGSFPRGVAVTPDGKPAYVTIDNGRSSTVSVIDTANNTVVATVPVGLQPNGVAVNPDGKHVYVAAFESSSVSVIDTATNKVVATVGVGDACGIAVTPDGKHVYVPQNRPGTVAVIDTATNTVVATVTVSADVPANLCGVGIVPPPPGIPFLAFNARLEIVFGGAPNQDAFALQSGFALSSTAPAINPVIQPVTLQAGTFAVTIPPGSFVKTTKGQFIFSGVINGVKLEVLIASTGTLRYGFAAKAVHASLTGTQNPAYVTLTIGGDSGATSVIAKIAP
jgi:YVTN family beta-propeller protein